MSQNHKGKKAPMPSCKEILEKKRIYDAKKDPVWVYLEREMRENETKKPYNEKVGKWLKFLKELKWYFYCEAQRKYKIIHKEVGPSWYFELSMYQRRILENLPATIHLDKIEEHSVNTQNALLDLGITVKFPKAVLNDALDNCLEDAGLLLWDIYTLHYKQPPCDLLPKYDNNAKLLMSCLFFIDLKDCIKKLVEITGPKPQPPPPPKPLKQRIGVTPAVKFGPYLQTMYATKNVSRDYSRKVPKEPVFKYKVKLRSAELERRRATRLSARAPERKCKYKFWQAPSTLRNKDPKMVAYILKQKIFKVRAKTKPPALDNIRYHLGTVCYPGGKPRFKIDSVVYLQTGYIPINGGDVRLPNGEYAMNILGYAKYPRNEEEKCDDTCNCLQTWDQKIIKHMKETKCKCGHKYDFKNTGKAVEKLFYPPNKYGPYWVDEAKVYQMDPLEDFIKGKVKEALRSDPPTPSPSHPTISATGLKVKELLNVFLADISDTTLITPHLPEVNRIHSLLEWTRKRVKGSYIPDKRRKQLTVKSQRRWLDIEHMDFKALAYRIHMLPEMRDTNWSHRKIVQKLFESLLDNFTKRNQAKQMELSRLFWTTMQAAVFPNHKFTETFYSYMPARPKDTYLVNPYSAFTVDRVRGKACPLWF